MVNEEFNPLNAELNPICYLLALFKDVQIEFGAHTDFYSMGTGVLFRM
jgi:hypothetical protein